MGVSCGMEDVQQLCVGRHADGMVVFLGCEIIGFLESVRFVRHDSCLLRFGETEDMACLPKEFYLSH